MRKVLVVDYKEAWVAGFDKERRIIERIIRPLSPVIHHIGSTAVPGLAAKPVIDLLIEVDDLDVLASFNEALQGIGYLAKGENGIPERRYFEKGGEKRSHHMHAFLRGSVNVRRHIAFRDYLKAFPNVAREYAAVKQSSAKACRHDSALYGRLKHDFVQNHERLAVEWCEQRA